MNPIITPEPHAAARKPRFGKRETHTADTKIAQHDPIVMPPITEPFQHPDPDIVVADNPADILEKNYQAQLAFMEEPVTIVMAPSQGQFAAPFVEATVNGKGVEVWIDGHGWLEIKQIPVNQKVTVKRKYVEVWARAKHTNVETKVTGKAGDGTEPINEVLRTTSLKHPFTVLEDRNPKGSEWLQRVLSGRA